ncbi:uncharacterized protein PGTG_11403 [Puccinia graminis f. sp. tritici CRL 75-36-700-3]|uniref:pectin lyase n=2 Tax=Puccinia graminis f. sp. tritici TaxID=56615 RepID=E3KLN5_PUCGT|nr:uncharacterized protein PGTG_11403 [Puccinia graminis f. sp. tritici CRL 75-36-700-3]EFP85234.2 hypothetical protein PGTG_11403 [Puccinia graminis f. sp. tritici CRL 75-36-700-3]
MAGSLSFILLCLQVVSVVLANSDPSAHIHRRSPEKAPKPSGSRAPKAPAPGVVPSPIRGPNGNSPDPKGTAKPVPFGFGSKVTGGGNATPQTPKDTAQLEAWLTDKVPRVILINKTYDFTSPTNTTANGCQPWKACSNGLKVQKAVNFDHWCSKEKTFASNIAVTIEASPLSPIKIGSRKTLLGVGRSAIIKGKGFLLYRVDNVIIQNIHITWLNPHIVWGGDGIMMDGAKNIWIDHCSFSYIGRQMIVTGGTTQAEANTGITISNNLFSGRTKWSARCQDRHYWTALFSGANDQITMARNCIDSTSGRSPKTGGSGNPKVLLHYYNNLHTNIIGETLEVGSGSNLLAEGNVFENVKIQDPGDLKTQDGGHSYVPLKPAEADRCKSILGRPCATNLLIQSSPYKFSVDTQAVDAFKVYPAAAQAKVLPASSIQHGVPGRCGVGYM